MRLNAKHSSRKSLSRHAPRRRRARGSEFWGQSSRARYEECSRVARSRSTFRGRTSSGWLGQGYGLVGHVMSCDSSSTNTRETAWGECDTSDEALAAFAETVRPKVATMK